MHAFHDVQEGIGEPRTHPWTSSLYDPTARFTDFRKHPELVETSLEDFIPYARFPGTQKFYELIRLLNRSESIWETTEAKFWPPSIHTNGFFSKYGLICSGRFVFFCRDYRWQCNHAEQFFPVLLQNLQRLEPTAPNACVGVFLMPTIFAAISEEDAPPFCQAFGVRCYGFGNGEDEVFRGFGIGVDSVRLVTDQLERLIELSPGTYD